MTDAERQNRRQPAKRAGASRPRRIEPLACSPALRAISSGHAERQDHPADRHRRDRGLQEPDPDPPPARGRRDGAHRPDRGRRKVRHAAQRLGAQPRTSLHRHVLADRRGGDGPSAPVPGGRSGRRRARHRRYPGEDGKRAGGRSGEHRPARRRCADPGRAGDEPPHVAASGDRGEHGGAGSPRRAAHRAERRIARRRRERPRADGRAGENPRRHRSGAGQRSAPAARRPPRAGHQRADLGSHRSGALHRQPLVRQAGPCDRRGAGGSGRRDGAGRRPGGSARSGRGRDRPCRKRTGYAGGLRKGPAGGYRCLRRRRFGLAGRAGSRPQNEEGRPGPARSGAD